MPWQRKPSAPLIVVTDAGFWSLILVRFPFLQYLSPALGGEVIDLESFCAAGPEWTPPITMADIVWIGLPADMARPHVLFSVTRAIARQELFAKYCESIGTVCQTLDQVGGWNWADPGVMNKGSGTLIDVAYSVSGPVGGATSVDAQLYTVNDAAGAGAVKIDEVVHAPLGLIEHFNVPLPAGGNYLKVGGSAYPGGGGQAITCTVCVTGGTDYDPGEVFEDPTVTLPTGTGSTVDQLEVKLDLIQQELQRGAGNRFNLDPTTMSGVGFEVTGQLLDAVGVLVGLQSIPSWATRWSGEPPRYHVLGTITFGNEDGWSPAIDLEHEFTVILPTPLGATRWALRCTAPVVGAVTLYRPTS